MMPKSIFEQIIELQKERPDMNMTKADPAGVALLDSLNGDQGDLTRVASVLGNDGMQRLLGGEGKTGQDLETMMKALQTLPGGMDAALAFQILPEAQQSERMRGNSKAAGAFQAIAYERVYGDMKGWLSEVAEDHQFDSVVLNDYVTDYLIEGTQKDEFGLILSSIQDALGDQKSDEDVYQYLVDNLSRVYLEKILRAVLDRGNEDADSPDAIDKYLEQLKNGEASEKIAAFKEVVLAQSAKVRSSKRIS